jgi:hypothetical protein
MSLIISLTHSEKQQPLQTVNSIPDDFAVGDDSPMRYCLVRSSRIFGNRKVEVFPLYHLDWNLLVFFTLTKTKSFAKRMKMLFMNENRKLQRILCKKRKLKRTTFINFILVSHGTRLQTIHWRWSEAVLPKDNVCKRSGRRKRKAS